MRRTRRPSPEKLSRDRWRQRVLDGMTPELRAALSPAEVMYLWAKATNGDTFFFAGETTRSVREKALVADNRLTQKGARWALRILEIYDAVPTTAGPYGWVRVAGYRRTVRIANGEPAVAVREKE